MAAYEESWLHFNGGTAAILGRPETYERPMGWPNPTPYMESEALLSLSLVGLISALLEELIGHPMGLRLPPTGWKSSRRDWHLDQRLNIPQVAGFYAAVWIALDDIHPDSGPFEYLPGSHKWYPPISQRKMREVLGEHGTEEDRPWHSEQILSPVIEQDLANRHVRPDAFVARRAGVLVWHSKLRHRGSIPRNDSLERRALIAHFSAIHRKPNMPAAVQHQGGWYFLL